MPDCLPRIGSALLVRDEANRILLGKRNKDPQRGSWVIPGGKIHAFESIAEAAARELREETGLTVEVGDHFNVYEIINPPNEHRIVIYSWAKVVEGEAQASDDISELKFFELKELGDVPVTPLVRQVLIDAGFVLDRPMPTKPDSIEDDQPGKGPGRHIACFILDANRPKDKVKVVADILRDPLLFEGGFIEQAANRILQALEADRPAQSGSEGGRDEGSDGH